MLPFVSPVTGNILKQEKDVLVNGSEHFPVVRGIPRFVKEDNYAAAFGLQWKTFSQTQHDSKNEMSLSLERVERCLGFPLTQLKNKNLLEAGSGAGRFTEIFVNAGALVHSFDLSVAVEANKETIGDRDNFVLAQASIYEIPFPKESFDIVICLGVIQHTPSPEKTIEALWKMVAPGGVLVIDHYRWRLSYFFNSKPLWRKFLRRMKPESSMKRVKKAVDYFFPLHWKYRNNKTANWLLHRISPLIEYINLFPEKDYQWHYELSYLDSYDSLTDYYKHLRTENEIENILKRLGAKDIWINRGGNGVEARGRK